MMSNNTANVEDRLGAAKLMLVNERPYLATAIWTLRDVKVKGLNTMATDKHWRLYYDPDMDWDTRTVASVIYHEIQHLLRMHFTRAEAVDSTIKASTVSSTKWNIAGDLEINDDIDEEGNWTLPDTVCLPEKFGLEREKMAEEYYRRLNIEERCGHCGSEIKDDADNKGKNNNSGNDSNNEGSENSPKAQGDSDTPGGDSSPMSGDSDSNSGDGESDGKCPACGSENSPASGACGSAADGIAKPWEKDSADGGISEVEGELIGKKTANEIKEHSQKTRGNVPGHWERWAENILEPKINWKEQMRVAINNAMFDIAGRMDYSYRRPNRRIMGSDMGVILPGMVEPVINIAVVVDTSGSMSQTDLEMCLAEVKGILKASGAKTGITILAVDASVHTTQRVFSAEQVTLAGGGGTDMGIGIKAADELRPRPDLIIVLTDGYTPWPQDAPASKVVIGILGSEENASGWQTPEYANVVYIDIQDYERV